jgi:demethylmenaquinone methyltransferase/2-methoxy-6-polyprenyl-1,4-benzoquinol methylase
MTFNSSDEKRAFTRDLFARISTHYELTNVVMSMGQVGFWRRRVAREARLDPGDWVLDVATGEGGLARALARRWPEAHIVGLDFTAEMLRIAQARPGSGSVDWTEGDALQLPFSDGYFATVVNGFMLRNVTDVEATLAEQARVLRPGGRLICLEMTWPRSPLFRPLFQLYFFGVVPLLGWLISGEMDAYRYLPRSVKAFMAPEELAATMRRVGLEEVTYRLFSFGTVTLHVGVKGSHGG